MMLNAIGQLGPLFPPAYHRPFLRYFDGENGGAGGGKEFKAPESQEELDRIVTERTRRAEQKARDEERAKYADYDELRTDAEKFRAARPGNDKAKNDDKPAGMSEEDVQKRIDARLAEKDMELAVDRASDQLDKALEGRAYSASKILSLDLKQFVNEDGKTVNKDALTEWVEKNSDEGEPETRRGRRLPGQGKRDSVATGGSVQAGRDLYDEKHSKNKSSRKD